MAASCDVFFDSTTKREALTLLRQYHYIGSQCADPTFTFVWRREGGLFGEHGTACAACLFAPPASFAWGASAIELTRLVRDETSMPPLTTLLSQSLSVLRKTKRFSLVIAYADPDAGHHGGVYQAGSWLYVGKSSVKSCYIHKETGKRSSQRSFDQSNYDRSEWAKRKTSPKYTYVFPLSQSARRQWLDKSLPFPKPRLVKSCGEDS